MAGVAFLIASISTAAFNGPTWAWVTLLVLAGFVAAVEAS